MVTPNAGEGDDSQSRSQQHLERMEQEQHIVPSGSGSPVEEHEHEHVFLTEKKCSHDNTSLVTKRCYCGFSIQVEEL